jgi:hypothetical protein
MAWIRGLSSHDYVRDTLLVAGDLSHSVGQLEAALSCLLEKFASVSFVPGNHDVWLIRGEYADSLHKFHRLFDLCGALGVKTRPAIVGEGSSRVWIVPLSSWYVKPEEGAESLFLPKSGDDGDLSAWSDEHFVKWPWLPGARTAAGYFLEWNRPHVERAYDAPVISFSHFLPRADLMFELDVEGRPARAARPGGFNFSRVAGTRALDEQIRTLGSRVHVHGHQHRNRWRTIDGILYVSHCLGYARERESGQIRHLDDGPKLIWERGDVPEGRAHGY